jgi:histidine triad (HIT) family protein
MNLDGSYDPDNVFAKVIRGELPAAKVFEDDEVLAFMDLFPQAEGHVLVISKASQARNLLDVSPEHLAGLMLGVQRVAKAVRAALEPDGIVITQFNGAPAGQTVFHLHFHVIPRYADEGLRGHAEGGAADPKALAELSAAIAAEIS